MNIPAELKYSKSHEWVKMDGEKIGWTSSGTFAPFIGCGVAMGYIPVEDIEIGKHLNADVRGRMVELEIVPMPFYKLDH